MADSTKVADLEAAVRWTHYVLKAIREGGLLDALPSGEEDSARHNIGVGLLELLEEEIKRADGYA